MSKSKNRKAWKLLLLGEEQPFPKGENNAWKYISAALIKYVKLPVTTDIVIATGASVDLSVLSSVDVSSLKNHQIRMTISNIESSKVHSLEQVLSPFGANVLADPLNIYRFPLLNTLNALEYLTISIFLKGYDEEWDKHIKHTKYEIIQSRFQRLISAFSIVLVLIIKEYKYHYAFAQDLITKIIKRFELFLCDTYIFQEFPIVGTLKSILGYLKSDQWPSGDTLSFVGSVYDTILGNEIMELIHEIILDEYILLIKLSGGPNIALSGYAVPKINNKNISVDDGVDNDEYDFIKSKQITLNNFSVYSIHPFYVIWNFLTLMAGMKTGAVEKKEEKDPPFSQNHITGRLSRHLLTRLLYLDMAVLLMCPVCSYGLREKIKTVSHMYLKQAEADSHSNFGKEISHIIDIPTQSEFMNVLKRRWQGLDEPKGISGARLVLNRKTKHMLKNLTNEIKRSNNNLHDLYAFLGFYLLYTSSRGESLNVTSRLLSLPVLGESSCSKLNADTQISIEMDNCWLLAVVGIWALRNAVRVGNNMEPYPLINYLSGFCNDKEITGEDLLQMVLSHSIVKNISNKRQLEETFAPYIDKNLFSIYDNNNKNNVNNIAKQKMRNVSNIKDSNISGLYVFSREKLEKLSLNDLLSMEKFPLTEYEIYK